MQLSYAQQQRCIERRFGCPRPHRGSRGVACISQGARVTRTGVRAAAAPPAAGHRSDDPTSSLFHKTAIPLAPLKPPSPTAPITTTSYTGDQLAGAFEGVINSVTVTILNSSSDSGSGSKAPVVIMFCAFLTTAACYLPLHRQLAAEGYAVVQYDIPYSSFFSSTFINREMRVFPELLKWLEQQNDGGSSSGGGSALQGRLDLDRLAVAGHSRGGKLAALNFCASQPGVKACYLIDPVDELPTKGVEALENAHTLKIGVTGFCNTGALNPERSNFRHFAAAAAPGSQLHELPKVTHLQILDAGALSKVVDWVDKVCLFPFAEQLVTYVFDWLSREPPAADLQVLLHQLLQDEKFTQLLRQLEISADAAQLRPVKRVLELLLAGDTASVAAALRQLGRLPRVAAVVGRMSQRAGVAAEPNPTAVEVTRITAAAMVQWLSQEGVGAH